MNNPLAKKLYKRFIFYHEDAYHKRNIRKFTYETQVSTEAKCAIADKGYYYLKLSNVVAYIVLLADDPTTKEELLLNEVLGVYENSR